MPKMYFLSKILPAFSRRIHTSISKPLQDTFCRSHDYLRISLTEKCNLRCKYCMPDNGIKLTNYDECLSLTEVKHLSSLFVNKCGVRKIRLTGGEPTIDRKLIPILQHLTEMKKLGLQTIAITTNGLTLKSKACLFKDLGLDVVNISLDSLKPKRFESMTRRKGHKLVIEGLHESLKVGFKKVKLNCVVVRGFNDDEIVDFVQLAKQLPIEIRFIEFMPFFGNKWEPNLLVPFKEMLQKIRDSFPELVQYKTGANETSKLFGHSNMPGSIGFITSMTDNFCSGCNRLRLTSDGNLKVCLFGKKEISLRDLLRNGATDKEIIKAIQSSLITKQRQHAAKRAFHHSPLSRQTTNNNSSTSAEAPSVGEQSKFDRFSHLDNTGKAKMVNIGHKSRVKRVALAQGEISIGINVLDKLLDGTLSTKGDIVTVAKVAGIMGAKSTSILIPMCHQIPLEHVQVDIVPRQKDGSLVVTAKVEAENKSGVELECLTAVSLALLTIYDMCKSISREMIISNVRLVYKRKPDT